jgi:hypothetical protein
VDAELGDAGVSVTHVDPKAVADMSDHGLEIVCHEHDLS